MKTKRTPPPALRKLSVLLTVAILFGVFACLPVGAEDEAFTDGDYEYTVENGEATITKYTGEGGDITVPSTLGGYPVAMIGQYAFYYGGRLNNVILPEGLKEIGPDAFLGSSIESVVLPESLKIIHDYGFYRCGLIDVTLPEGLESVGSYAFSECWDLKSITFPENLKRIEMGMFHTCENLTSVTFPKKLESIGSNAFTGCPLLKELSLPKGLKSIEERAFWDCELQTITIPISVTTIEKDAFDLDDDMTDIYCEAPSQPAGWDENWLGNCPATVHWGVKIPDDNVLTDEGSDVSVTFPEDRGAYYTGATLTAEKLETGDSYDTAKGALSAMYSQFVPYDLSLTDITGKALPVSGKITVSVPVPDGWKAADTAVYYVSEDGKAEQISCKPSADGNAVEFETDHFSIYTLVNLTSSVRTLGDLSGDGKVNSTDYMLLKRHVLGTYKLSDAYLAFADFSGDGRVNSTDYMLLKRAVLGTYKLAAK